MINGRAPTRHHTRRGSVVIIALWSVAIGAILVGAVQISAHRQARLGSLAVDQVRARWAARAGVEQMVAILSYDTVNPVPDDAYALKRELEAEDIAFGSLVGATYSIYHNRDYEYEIFYGPIDEHSKLNINAANREQLMTLPFMNDDIVDAIIDWIDSDDIPTGRGGEANAYMSAESPYGPRNGPMRSITELELVAGVIPEFVREEDWNLNGQLDPNEDDGGYSWPIEDDANGELNTGWSGKLTARSVDGGYTVSGLPRLYLPDAEPEAIQDRLSISRAQAEALKAFASNPDNAFSTLWVTPLSSVNPDGTAANNFEQVNDAENLDPVQLAAVFEEATMDDPSIRHPGKININTAPEQLIRDVLREVNAEQGVVDQIIYQRQSRSEGFPQLVDLTTVPGITAPVLADVTDLFTTRSNVFTIPCTGRTDSGVEVQLIVVVDRSALPVRIVEYREQ